MRFSLHFLSILAILHSRLTAHRCWTIIADLHHSIQLRLRNAGFCLVLPSRVLKIHLADTGEPLRPELEAVFFPRDPPREYRVLRWRSGRSRRSLKDDPTNSSISLQLPIGDSKVDLILEKVNLAIPDLKLSFDDSSGKEEEEEEVRVPQDCFYSGGTSTSWAVISTCSGLIGVVEQGGHPYHVEEVGPREQPSSRRHRRAALDSLVVVYPLTEHLGREAALPPAIPDFDEDSEFEVSDDTIASLDNPSTSFPFESSTSPEGRGHRVRRQTVKDPYTVELAVFVDRTLYSYVKKRYPTDGVSNKVVEIVMTLVNAVHRLYADASLKGVNIAMLVKRVEVLGSGKPSQNKGDIYKYLKQFCRWQSQKNPRDTSKGWDHALLLSGHDLWSKKPSDKSIVGLAFVGGMCSSSFSCTINEGTSFAAAYIIAHEMGHSLNMKHDGGLETWKCKKNKFIMSPVMASGATTWSSCSKNSLVSFLSTKGSCLTPTSTHIPNTDEKNHNGPAPGKRFDAHDQCYYMYGKGWQHFSNSQSPFDDVCREIWCRKGRLLRTPSASALDGTSCGNSKVCKRGTCVKAKKTAKRIEKEKTRSGRQVEKETKIVKTGNDNKSLQKTRFKRMKIETGEMKKGKLNKEKKGKKKQNKSGEKRTRGKLKNVTKGKGANPKKIKFKNKENKARKLKVTKKKGKPKSKAKKEIKKKYKSKKNKLTANNEITSVKLKKKIKEIKKPEKIRRIETPTQIIIKERLKFVEGKGWKIRIMRIKKTKGMIKKSQKKKKGKQNKCKSKNSKCKKVKSKKKKNKNKSSKKGRKESKVPGINNPGGNTIGSPSVGGHGRCEPQKLRCATAGNVPKPSLLTEKTALKMREL
ncbi:A disintegrin and metalloproteinase with thrombospondin motifs 1-like isoform X2 [Panulirus ornatus]|uniref:A disintegrin and metalloproteinase with thrombospondin motifs 1-like isoform X2 n=1 Tax=Panulirus ornatus TaxID=150431 RepID=UPI003A8784CA